jgi:hypothetical protein
MLRDMSMDRDQMQRRLRTAAGPRSRITKRIGLAVVALGAGVAIALVDSSPGWDSTGVTALTLFGVAAVVAWIAGDRPWLWALLVGLPTPILEITQTGTTGSILALGFACAGAAAGWATRRSG